MKKFMSLIAALALLVSCGSSEQQYVRKAVRIMDRQGLFAQGPEWDKAKKEALSAKPATLEDALTWLSTQGQ